MPSGFAAIDTGFPDLGKYDSTEQKLQAMEDYLVQLLENLRYTLHNLGVENLNVSSVKELGDIITEPIRAEIDDPDTGLSARIDANAAAITAEVRRATGEESALQQTADGIKAQVTDGQGNYTVLNLKSGGLYVGNAQGATKISGSNILAGSVTANEIAANAITAGKISADALSGYNIYGAKYWDADGNGLLQITGSQQGYYNLYFGPPAENPSIYDAMFGIRVLGNGTLETYLRGMNIIDALIDSQDGYFYTDCFYRWRFGYVKIKNQLVLSSGYGYGSSLPPSGETGQVFFKI